MSDARRSILRSVVSLAILALLVGVLAVWQPSGLYLWLKAAHVVAVIIWMAGMLYMPRLFVYHCKASPGSECSETFKVMERRLLTMVVNPAMILAWALGLWLAWDGGWVWSGWLHAKLTLVVALSGLHGFYARWTAHFGQDRNRHSQRFYNIVNELLVIILIVVVILVIVKPF